MNTVSATQHLHSLDVHPPTSSYSRAVQLPVVHLPSYQAHGVSGLAVQFLPERNIRSLLY